MRDRQAGRVLFLYEKVQVCCKFKETPGCLPLTCLSAPAAPGVLPGAAGASRSDLTAAHALSSALAFPVKL